MTDQNLVNLAKDLNSQYQRAFQTETPPTSSELDAAVNAVYAQVPYYMKVETRHINPLHKSVSRVSVAQELLSDLPRLVMDSDLPATKKLALLNSIGDIYRKYIS